MHTNPHILLAGVITDFHIDHGCTCGTFDKEKMFHKRKIYSVYSNMRRLLAPQTSLPYTRIGLTRQSHILAEDAQNMCQSLENYTHTENINGMILSVLYFN